MENNNESSFSFTIYLSLGIVFSFAFFIYELLRIFYIYLKTGTVGAFSTLSYIESYDQTFFNWLKTNNDWIGFKYILTTFFYYTPFALFVLLLCLFLLPIASSIDVVMGSNFNNEPTPEMIPGTQYISDDSQLECKKYDKSLDEFDIYELPKQILLKNNSSNELYQEDEYGEIYYSDLIKENHPTLVLLVGPESIIGKEWSLNGENLVIGRSPSSAIYVDDLSISKSHAKIILNGQEAHIMDLESTNKTIVNNKLVSPLRMAILKNNDHIKVGNVIFKFLEKGNIEALSNKKTFDRT